MSGGVAILIALLGAKRTACTPSDKLSGGHSLAPTHREAAGPDTRVLAIAGVKSSTNERGRHPFWETSDGACVGKCLPSVVETKHQLKF